MNNINDGKTVHSCTGCSICAAVCPVSAITMALNEDGFYTPRVDASLCTECGQCKRPCYKYDEEASADKSPESNPVCYGAKNLDKQELMSSTSGAVSIELMRRCLRLGYKVAGVAYDIDKKCAVTRIASSENELEAFKGSKYFQSYTQDAFRGIVRDKTSQKYAVFGTPCQIYALSKYAHITKQRGKYLFVDLFCHGCPSIKLWHKYLSMIEKKMGSSGFERIVFRSKSHGWHESCFTFTQPSKSYTTPKHENPFFEIFYSLSALNEACYTCAFRSSFDNADIRIGDFWGKHYAKDHEGVSAVLISTQSGQAVFDAVKSRFDCAEIGFSETVSGQPAHNKKQPMDAAKRKELLNLLKSDLPIKKILRRYRRTLPRGSRLKAFARRSLKRLPAKSLIALRELAHRLRK